MPRQGLRRDLPIQAASPMTRSGISRFCVENRVAQGLEVDRLGEVLLEAGFAAAAEVVVLAEAAEGDGADVLAGAEVAHDVQASAVGEADVAEEQVEGLAIGLGDSLAYRANGGDIAAQSAEEHAVEAAGGLVVLPEP